jgi:uncharacterized membrane protein
VNYIFVVAIGIGIVAGLRAFLAPAIVAWAAHLGSLDLHSSPLAFMGSTVAVAIFSIFAIGELSRGQAAKDSETDRLRTLLGTHPPGRP